MFKIAERRLQASNTFSTDYEVEVELAFYTENKDAPFIYFRKTLSMMI